MIKWTFVLLFLLSSSFLTDAQTLSRQLDNRRPRTIYFPDGNAVFVPANSFCADTVRLHFRPFYRISHIATAGLPDSRQLNGSGILVFDYAFRLTATNTAGSPVSLCPNRQLQLRLLPTHATTRQPPALFLADTTTQNWQRLAVPVASAAVLPFAVSEAEEGAAKEGVIAPWSKSDGQQFWEDRNKGTRWIINSNTTGSFALGHIEQHPARKRRVLTQPTSGFLLLQYDQPASFFRAGSTDDSLPLLQNKNPSGLRALIRGRYYDVSEGEMRAWQKGALDTLLIGGE